jgi:hypothetical protein
MFSHVTRFGLAALVGLALFGPVAPQARAQRIISPVNFNNRIPPNPNYYLNQYTPLRQYAFNTAVLGQAFSNIPPYMLGYNPYPPINIGPSFPINPPFAPAVNPLLTTGGLGNPYLSSAGLANPYLSSGGYGGGYGGGGGATLSTTGGYGGGGYSYSTDPYGAGGAGGYSNPYNGYLTGAASVTSANGQYQNQIQQARLLREQSRQAAIDTRRKLYDEAMYEARNRPTSQDMIDRDRQTALTSARRDAPMADVLSASALNALYRQVAKEQGVAKKRGPNVPLGEDLLKEINLSPLSTRANVGLLKDDGKLSWPAPLQDEQFAPARKKISQLIEDAVQQVKFGNPVKQEDLRDLRENYRDLSDRLRNSVSDMSPTDYIVAQRYLRQVGDALKALEDPKAANYFTKWKAKGKNVAELVQNMSDAGLEFAPAAPGQENAYRSLYNALQAFDAGMQVASK